MSVARTTHIPHRIATLDVLRALAILLVVFHHVPKKWVWSPLWPVWKYIGGMGWIGVDLFFVLSGWLIGGLYFAEEKQFGNVERGRFWIRRWIRTLPPYFAALLLVAAVRYWEGSPMRLGWREAFFLQNYLLNFDYLIPASWSLCIEEHFYLGLPLLIPLLPRRRAVILLPVLILALTAIRSAVYLHALHGGVAIHHQYFYTRTHFRLENLMLGVWLALLRTRHPAMWSALMRRARWIGVIGYAALVAIVIGVFQRARVPWFNPFVDTVGFTLIGLCFACILIEARGENSILRHVPSRLTTPIALCSYSTYLTHHCLALRWTFMLVSSHKWIATTRCSMGIFLALTGIIAAIGYWGVEKPAIALRDRWFPRRSETSTAPNAVSEPLRARVA